MEQTGGADEDATASVFRNENGKLKKAGEFSMQKLGDFIEKEISKSPK